VYDCGHKKHKNKVKSFLESNLAIKKIHVVVSHNDSDHTSGVCDLLAWLSERDKYDVVVYSHQYLKHVDTILDKIDDGRRSRESLKKALIAEFDNIAEIIEAAQGYGFLTEEALKGTSAGNCTIVGPTVDEFTDVAAQAVDSRVDNNIGEGHAEETVMNAASVQLKCRLDNGETILLCGDASPDYLHELDIYDIIQSPHHGQLDDAKAVFEVLKDPYSKTYFISDNTGSGDKSGGSDDLVRYMKDEYFDPAYNTQDGVVDIPGSLNIISGDRKKNESRGATLGVLDFRSRHLREQ